ncbi:histidine phosphatase superfamily [Kockovaella imperatae]|uniref:Histidine phosphatase superfamily n=1 Tax=Kockovaella imperatae TaxID=4999 RepID=A0A1Y1U9T9_9TREE|nr:histidine phosphatase superfamily [Kockovaella imperatae]ORX34803.1 histidine phosphatase superfamily [Kockovaella imperatae]
MLQYLYICRHGYRDNFDVAHQDQDHIGGYGDPPLTLHGLEQAQELASFLSDDNHLSSYPIPERIFSSPFYRCVQTSVPLLSRLRQRKPVTAGLSLENGVQEWLLCGTEPIPEPASATMLAAHLGPDVIDLSYETTVYPSSRGESESDLKARLGAFLNAWIPKIDAAGIKSAVIVSHAAAVIVLGRLLSGDSDLHVPTGCASTSLYRRTELTTAQSRRSLSQAATQESSVAISQWVPVWLGRTDYLGRGSEREWQFGDPHV